MRIRVDSIGCRLNIGEMEHLARQFASRGHRIVGPGDAADLFVFNSCAVTHVASRKSRKTIRQLRRRNPEALVVVTGCYSELSPIGVEALGVDRVIANRDKDRLAELLEQDGVLSDADPLGEYDESPYAELAGSRTRAFVKVQDGCDNRCTFCIVTVARGAGRSLGRESIVQHVGELVDAGYQEIVLSGVHLGSYGNDLKASDGLRALTSRLLSHTAVRRLRLSSLEPWDLEAGFFDLWHNDRLLPHLHLPLQSGCDATLLRMSRHTDQKSFARLLTAARAAIPNVAISTDVIVGFPGESDSEFEDSFAFVAAMGFSRVHVFRYSARAGTAAARMSGQVAPQVAQARSRRMHEVAALLEKRFQKRFVGDTLDVLWESSEAFGDGWRWSGLTGNYLRVVTDTDINTDLHNRVTSTVLQQWLPGAIYGETAASITRDFDQESTSPSVRRVHLRTV